MQKRSYLALFRAGPQSLHPHAVAKLTEQNFDYALSYFGNDDPPSNSAVFVHRQKGAKWPGLRETLLAHRDVINEYDYVWLPDDDLLCAPETVSRMFLICSDLRLDLAQPALTADSFFSHPITIQHSQFQMRFTNFVEIMAPVLSRNMLSKVLPTLEGQISGYGLDSLWPRLTELGRVAIIDETAVKHTRPIGGPNYAVSASTGVSPVTEDQLVSAKHFIESRVDAQINFAGLLANGDTAMLGEKAHEHEPMLKALINSVNALQMADMQRERYLLNHVEFAMQANPRYPRGLIGVVLDQALAGTGISFKATSSAASARDPLVAAQAADSAFPPARSNLLGAAMAVDTQQDNRKSRNKEPLIHEVFGGLQDSLDVMKLAQFDAAWSSARFYQRHMHKAPNLASADELMILAAEHVDVEGFVAEFGVASGSTINHLARLFPEHRIYGFDVFSGLPETWRTGFATGAFAQRALPSVAANVELVVGLFEQTLPAFVRDHSGPVALMHVDCDLYSATKTIFAQLGSRLRAGSVVVFDEFFNYPGWKHHEFQAWKEFCAATGMRFEFIGFVGAHQQVAVRCLGF